MKIPRFLALLSLAALTAFPALAENNTPPPGYTALFDGKTLSGWYGWSTQDPNDLWKLSPEEQAEYKKKSIEGGLTNKKGAPVNDHVNAHWRVENGELINDGNGLYLTTDKDYGDFELLIEYKALPEGDSGVYLRGVPQVQIWDSTQGDPRGLGQDKGSGGLWNNSKGSPGKDPSKKMDKPFGEWNTMRIRMIGERVTVVFNGETVVDNCALENYFANKKAGYQAWVKQPAKDAKPEEKLPNGFMRDPVFPKGPIQLQTHGSEIRWRNIYLHEITPEEADQELRARSSDDGFVELVNGKDLSNWQNAVDGYEMMDGAIVCKPKGGDLLSMEEYEDCIIKVEFKLPHAGNNGIALRTPLGGHPSRDGFEIQVLDSDGYNEDHKDHPLLPYQYHGSLYHCVGAKHGYLRPMGTWNYEEIEVRGQKIKVTLNGTKILDVDCDTFDRSQIEHPPKGLDHRKGYIGFCGHQDPVEFRSFKVKRLD